MSDLYDQIGPDSTGSLGTPDQWTTIGDYLAAAMAGDGVSDGVGNDVF